MKREKENLSLEEKARQVIKEVTEQKKEPVTFPEIGPGVKVGLYITGAFILLWSSQYIFSALAGSIRSFKELKRSIREK